jgi:multisubunit Na+/H+ antiporter MnhE subunit
VWFVLLEGLWVVFVGTRQSTELVAGLIAAAIGAVFAEVLRSLGLLPYRADLRLLAQIWKLAWQLPFDFAVLTWVLVRSLVHGRRVRGSWVRTSFEADDSARGNWRRAFAAIAGTATPNAIVVDIEGGEALLHSLEPRLPTGREAV